MIKSAYKSLIKKFNLSKDQLRELKEKLEEQKICKGPFFEEGKMCPNTTALSIKEKRNEFESSDEVVKLLNKYGVSRIELWKFYCLFDLPAMISKNFFSKALREMRFAVDELIRERSA